MSTPDPSAALSCSLIAFFLCAVFNLARSSAVYLDDSELKNAAASQNKRAMRLERMLLKHDQLKVAVKAASSLCLAASVLPSALLLTARLEKSWRFAAGNSFLVCFIIALIFALLFFALAIHTPAKIASYFPRIAYSLEPALTFCRLLFTPFAAAAQALCSLLIRLLGKNPHAAPDSVTEEEIRMLVDEGNEHGTIEESEKDMINNIFEFDNRDVSQVMTHRTELSAVEIRSTLEQVAQVAIESGYSRLPVYEDDIDSICGIIYAKDLIKYIQHPENFHLSSEMRKPIYVPESSSCSTVFALLQKERTQIAVVVDEYGGTYGVVTMEDLLESIVGNIEDEYDNEELLATKIDEGVYLLDGSVSISDAERLLDFFVPDDSEADTIGGFVIELLGGVPHSPSDPHTVTFGGVTFTVLHSDARRIGKIRAVVNARKE